MWWIGHVACIRAIRNSYKILVGKSEGKISFKRSAIALESNIKTDSEERG